MPKTTRTFIALPVPEVLRGKLERLQRLIAPNFPQVRWIERADFHLTLAFLGDVHDVDLSRLCKSVAEGVKGFGPVDLVIRGLGAFPDMSKPRVLWCGLEGDLERLQQLQQIVFEAADRGGYRPDAQQFRPHVTLGHIKIKRGQEVDMSSLEAHYRGWAAGGFTSDTVVTFASSDHPEGPHYSALGNAALGKRPA
jgi:2'-5' RNA ligase